MRYLRGCLATLTIFALNYWGLFLYLTGHKYFGFINTTISILAVYFVVLIYMESDFFKNLEDKK